MLGIQTIISVSPHSISSKDVVRFIPRLRFSSHRKEQLQAEKNEQEAECGNFVRGSQVKVHFSLSENKAL